MANSKVPFLKDPFWGTLRAIYWPLRAIGKFYGLPQVRAILRVMVYGIVVCVVVAFFGARSAKGSLAEQGLIVGRQIAKLEDLTAEPTTLMLNGQRINVTATVVESDHTKVLDRVQAVCESDSAAADAFQSAANGEASFAKRYSLFKASVLRRETSVDGVVACVMNKPGQQPGFATRIKRMAVTTDFGELGLMRYAYVQNLSNGRSRVVTAWTDGEFKFGALVPEAKGKDAPGADPSSAPRPPRSVRYLAAHAVGHPHGVFLYETQSTRDGALRFYGDEMAKRGWRNMPELDARSEGVRHFFKGNVDLMVAVQEFEGRVSVTMVETRSN
ncbi:MAG: hypothetical protein R3B13_07785 [Polyangiaceae bacterium]